MFLLYSTTESSRIGTVISWNVLNVINTIASEGVTYRETGDYGTQPDFYVNIKIGEFSKPYIHN
jgi:hypothetical protein